MFDAHATRGGRRLIGAVVIAALWTGGFCRAAEKEKSPDEVSVSAAAATRVWTSKNGAYTVRAVLLESQGENVRLKTADGRTITVRLDALSEADRQYVAGRAPQAVPPSGPEKEEQPAAVEDDAETSKAQSRKLAASLEKVLAKKADLDFKGVPLAEVLGRVGDQYGIDIVPLWQQIDEGQEGPRRRANRAKVPAGKTGSADRAGSRPNRGLRDTPVTVNVSGEKLGRALTVLLRDVGLRYYVCDNSIMVTSPEHYEFNQLTRVYPLPPAKAAANPVPRPQVMVNPFPLAKGMPGVPIVSHGFDFDSVIDGLESIVAPTSWQSVGGPGAVAPIAVGQSPVLVIRQTSDVHDEIAAFLKTAPVPANRSAFGPRGKSKASVALRQPCPVDFKKAKLPEALAVIEGRTKVRIRVDRRSLEDIAVDADKALVTFSAAGLTVRNVLTYMLGEIDAGWTVVGDVIVVGAAEGMDKTLETIRYPIGDLLPRLGNDRETLVAVLTEAVEPLTWDENGGPGSIVLEPQGPSGPALAVSQEYRVHEQIADLLAALRTVAGTGARRR